MTAVPAGTVATAATAGTAGTADDGRLAQLTAIERSGWGQGFRLWQPHNVALWVGALGVLAGAFSLVHLVNATSRVYLPSAFAGVAVWALYCLPWVLFLRHKDRYEREPAKLAGVGFVWGGLAATFALALPGNGAMLSLYGKLISPDFAARWGAPLTAPLVEETSKAAGIVLLIVLAPHLVRSAYDGLILGAFVGLGFQVFEDWLYTVQGAADDLGQDQVLTVFRTFVSRGIVSGFYSHALYSALFGMGIVWLVGRPGGASRRVGRGLLFVALAVVFHGCLDAFAVQGRVVLLPVLALVCVAVIVGGERWAARQERVWMRDLMAPEADRGTITADELAALAGSHRDRRRFVKAAGHGHEHHHQARHVLHAATDLAEEIARAGGAETPEVAFSRQEVLRLRGA